MPYNEELDLKISIVISGWGTTRKKMFGGTYIFGVKRRSLEIAILPPLIHFAAFSAGSIHLKKPSGGPMAL